MEPSVSAFAPGQSYRSIPYARIPLSEARQMVADGFAKTVNRGRSIEFFALKALKLRDRSCSWSHRLMELVGDGNYAACKMLEHWDEEMLDVKSPLGRTVCPLRQRAA